MDKKIFLAAFVGAVVSFLLGWLIFGIALHGYYTENMKVYEGLVKKMPNLIGIFIAGFFWAFLLSYIFSKWAHINTFAAGFTAALFIGVITCISYDLSFYSMMNLYRLRLIAVDVIASSLVSAVVGGTIAAILGSGKSTTSTSV
ncbi:MAG: hypothetical protein ABI772_02090 [Bacteroidota bacterium]